MCEREIEREREPETLVKSVCEGESELVRERERE